MRDERGDIDAPFVAERTVSVADRDDLYAEFDELLGSD